MENKLAVALKTVITIAMDMGISGIAKIMEEDAHNYKGIDGEIAVNALAEKIKLSLQK